MRGPEPHRSRIPELFLALVVAAAWPAGAGTARGATPPSGPDPCLHLTTGAGDIVIRFSRAAAPRAVAAIEKLARGPLYDARVLPHPEAAEKTGYFDGMSFDYARPHLELRLPVRVPAKAFTVEAELDAHALGLDARKVADRGEAMNKFQFELGGGLDEESGNPRVTTPTLDAWVKRYKTDYDPSFLIGKSYQELNEAIGYRYESDLSSLPANKGAVALVPVSPTEAELSLTILLVDHPIRTGRWVVVGTVVQGLDVADAISARPLAAPALRDYRPRFPVSLDRVELTSACEPAAQGERP
jgi:cyclophilin family peptidyl-prolyl cis-trans isomerase